MTQSNGLNVSKSGGKPPRILIYGPQKIGKSSFGSLADSPVFVQAEDGLDNIDANAFPLAKTFQEIMTNLTELATQPHDFKTVVIDSLDWMEPMIWQQVCQEHNVKTIEEVLKGYGKGYVQALNVWREYIDAINYLREEKRMTVVQIAHAHIKRFENPETDAYDRYEIKLHKSASSLVMEHSDIILFANYFVGIKKEDKAMSKEGRKRAVGSGERVLYTEERPSFMAGNRYGLPAEIPFDKEGQYWNVIAQHVPFFNQPAQTKKDA